MKDVGLFESEFKKYCDSRGFRCHFSKYENGEYQDAYTQCAYVGWTLNDKQHANTDKSAPDDAKFFIAD